MNKKLLLFLILFFFNQIVVLKGFKNSKKDFIFRWSLFRGGLYVKKTEIWALKWSLLLTGGCYLELVVSQV